MLDKLKSFYGKTTKKNNNTKEVKIEYNSSNFFSELKKANHFFDNREYEKACKLYLELKNNPLFTAEAMSNFGNLFYMGKGVHHNHQQSFYWTKKSAELGNVLAMHNLGLKYKKGEGTSANRLESLFWFKKAAERGKLSSMNLIGQDAIVNKEYVNAVFWFRKTADLDNADGMFFLGIMYCGGHGVTKDLKEGYKWFKKVVDNTSPLTSENMESTIKSATQLGKFYYQGEGVVKDRMKALAYFRTASKLGGEESRRILDKLGER